jgi:hypothetical protein
LRKCNHTKSDYNRGRQSVSPVVTCPPLADFEACDIDEFNSQTPFPFSATATTISIVDFESIGGIVYDNCNVYTITYQDVSDGLNCPETITRTFTVSDNCGNVIICTQTITLNDYTPPTFTVPDDITIYKDEDCNYVATVDITGDVTDTSDDCSTVITIVFVDFESTGTCALVRSLLPEPGH